MLEAKPQLDEVAARALVGEALDQLFAEEYDLLEEGSERAVSAQYARHLAHALRQRSGLPPGRWSVDCEYHRLGTDPKALPRHDTKLAAVALACGWPTISVTGRVVPDVIVHRRGSGRGDGNLIVCELKRVGASDREIAADLVKLAGYIDWIGYAHAFLIQLGDTRDACVVHRASASLDDIILYVRGLDEAAKLRRWKRGHALAAQRQRQLRSDAGAEPAQSVAESLSALNAMESMAIWPAPRDAFSQRGIDEVRRRWARVQRHAKQVVSR